MIISSNDLHNFNNRSLPMNNSNKSKFSVSGLKNADKTEKTHKVMLMYSEYVNGNTSLGKSDIIEAKFKVE